MLYGGPQATIFGLIVACFVQWLIALGLAEQASAFPSSGGKLRRIYFLPGCYSLPNLSHFVHVGLGTFTD